MKNCSPRNAEPPCETVVPMIDVGAHGESDAQDDPSSSSSFPRAASSDSQQLPLLHREPHHPREARHTSGMTKRPSQMQLVDEELASWVMPTEHASENVLSRRRASGLIECLLVTSVFGLGVYLVLSTSLRTEWRGMYLYILASLATDVILALLIGLLLCCLRLLCGEASMRHATAFSSIFLQVVEGAACYALVGVGVYYLATEYDRLSKQPLLLSYLVMEVLVALVSTLGTCPVVFGSLKYALEKIQRKIRGTPLVEFQGVDPPWNYNYDRVEDCTSFLERMHPPRNSPDFVELQEQRLCRTAQQATENDEIGTLGQMKTETLLDKMGVETATTS